jgi:hypothetical protein
MSKDERMDQRSHNEITSLESSQRFLRFEAEEFKKNPTRMTQADIDAYNRPHPSVMLAEAAGENRKREIMLEEFFEQASNGDCIQCDNAKDQSVLERCQRQAVVYGKPFIQKSRVVQTEEVKKEAEDDVKLDVHIEPAAIDPGTPVLDIDKSIQYIQARVEKLSTVKAKIALCYQGDDIWCLYAIPRSGRERMFKRSLTNSPAKTLQNVIQMLRHPHVSFYFYPENDTTQGDPNDER